ncbi:MAG: HDIG domain-containing metalloprotein [Candidatus Woesearchaeota archaeon]
MDSKALIDKYYSQNSLAYSMLIIHGKVVSQKALSIAKRFQEKNSSIKLNFKLIEEAALLHDIGVQFVHDPVLGCQGKLPYICHGYLGAELLRKEGLPFHALICERHVGVGLSKADIIAQQLPLPHRDMIPLSWEEKIVCFSDKFFSKNKEYLTKEKSLEKIRVSVQKWGEDKVKIFDEWCRLFL